MPFIALSELKIAATMLKVGEKAWYISTALWLVDGRVKIECRGPTVDYSWSCASSVVF